MINEITMYLYSLALLYNLKEFHIITSDITSHKIWNMWWYIQAYIIKIYAYQQNAFACGYFKSGLVFSGHDVFTF